MSKKCFSLSLKNKIFLLVLLKVTDKTKGGETGKEEGEKEPWHQWLENDSLWVENVSVVSHRQELKQRNPAERAWKMRAKYF